MIDEACREAYRERAMDAQHRRDQYHSNAVASDYPEDRDFWKAQEAKQELLFRLNASLAGIEE